jgi:hypothetical protein
MTGKGPLCFLAFLALALLPGRSSAQVDAAALARDTHIFRRLFHDQGCRPIASELELIQYPRETVLVILGDISILQRFPIAKYVARGGSLLIATDRKQVGNDLHDFGITLHGAGRLSVRVEPEQGYHQLADCPFVIPTDSSLPLFHSGNETLNKVATNRSGFLSGNGSPLKVLARFPLGASHREQADNPSMVFAMGDEFGAGRVLILADHSVFINVMLFPTDNQNLEFASNCVDWLTQQGRRQRVFFSDEGHIQRAFDLPLKESPPPPLPSPEALVAAFDQVMAGLERENRFNELIAGLTSNNISRERAVALTIIGLSFVMGLFALQRLNAAKHRREHGIVPLAATIEDLELGRPIHELRSQALFEQGNYWEAAHELAIDMFEPLLAAAGPAGRLHVDSAGSFWQSWRWRRQAKSVWRLAVDPRPRRWTRRQWLRLLALDHHLRRDIALGKISLVAAVPIPEAVTQEAMPKFHSAR